MNYIFFKSISDYIYGLIDRIGVDTFVTVSIFLWIFFIWNILKRGTRF